MAQTMTQPSASSASPPSGPAHAPAMDSRAQSLLPDRPRVLIIRFSSLGDVVKCTALPRLIQARYPGARIAMVTASDYLQLIAHNPHLEQAIGFDRREGFAGLRALARRLNTEPFDLIVDVHHSLRSRLLTALLRGPRTAYGKRTLQRFLLLNFRINTYGTPDKITPGKEQDFLAGLLPYGVRDDGLGTEVHTESVASDEDLRQRLGAELQRIAAWRKAGLPVMGLAPIAAWELKRWPMENFRQLAQAYARETGGGLILFGGPGDREVEGLLHGLGDRGVSLVGRTSHLESAWFASLADIVISNDTGMSHLAEAVGTDAIVLFGPTSRELGYYPVRAGSLALEAPLPCRPCTKAGESRCRHPLEKACLKAITPQMVLQELLGKLGRTGRKAAPGHPSVQREGRSGDASRHGVAPC